jgi:hypothetical protein
MELLIPGFLLLLVAVLLVFFVIPQFGPTFTLIASALLLTGGIFHHYKLFRDEYRFATWADRLKAYGPGIMYGVFTLFIIGFIFSLWKSGAVPVPDSPSPETATPPSPASNTTPLSNITETLSNITNTASNAVEQAVNTSKQFVTNVANTVANYRPNFFNPEGAAPTRPAAPYGYGAPQPQPQPQPQAIRNYRPNQGRNASFFSEF